MNQLNGTDLLARVSQAREAWKIHHRENLYSGTSLEYYPGIVVQEVTVAQVSRTRVLISVGGDVDVEALREHLGDDIQGWEFSDGTPWSSEPSASVGASDLGTVLAILSALLDGPLAEAEAAHAELGGLEAKVADVRQRRDDAIRAAIGAGATMYAIGKRLGITEQAVRRIRDRG